MSIARLWASGSPASPIVPITSVDTSITASGNSDPIVLDWVERVMATATCGSATGTSPTLAVTLATQDAQGNWLPVLALSNLTDAAAFQYGTAGPGTANVYPLGALVRFQWVIGGTDTPTFPTFKLSLIGR